MERESLVQPTRELMFFETDPELPGQLQVPERPQAGGGYADIYRGIWINPRGQQINVAVKELKDLIPNDRQTDPAALIRKRDTRMRREVFVWRQLAHPNLHPLLGYRSEPKPRLISPWCRHGNLSHYLQRNPGLSRLDKLRLIFQVACGLEHLHAQTPPVCHADIKPENVLVNDLLRAALSDFGLSRVLGGFGYHSGFTTSNTIKGTYNYTAPELFNQDLPRPTLNTDVYAFGGLILTVMSGKRPFYRLRQPAILRRVIQNEPPTQEEHQELSLSDPLWSLMHCCWNMVPETRPPMQEVLRELWREICREELNPRSTPSVPRNDDADPSYMDAPGKMATSEVFDLHGLGSVLVDSSLANIETAGEPLYAMSEGAFPEARKILETLEVDSKIIRVIGGYVAAATDIALTLLEIARAMDQIEGMAKIVGFNTVKLVGRLEQLREEWITRHGERLVVRVIDVQRELQCIQRNIGEWYSSGLFLSAFSCSGHVKGLKECERMAKKVLEETHLLVSLNTTDLVAELKNTEMQKEHRRLLARLGDGNYGVTGNALEDVICFPGTRVDILDQIDDWVRGTSGSERALSVRGVAGSGKSTIASTVFHHWKFRASCAIFHFRRGQDALNSRVVCALARQLGSSLVSEVRNAVLESIRGNEDIATQQLSEQFKTLLVDPLGQLKEYPHPIVIIVDALDECHNTKDVMDFVGLIHRHSSSFPSNVKFLLTCRSESGILRAPGANQWDAVDLDSASEVSNDLARFIHHACTQIRDEHNLPENWPSTEDLARLVDRSQGLFQWARTAITYINSGSPVDRLRSLLRRQLTGSSPIPL